MSFFRHREIFRSDAIQLVRERRCHRPRPHRLDEFPAGYSSADCSPAGSASASPTEHHFALKSSCRSILSHRTVNSVLTVCLSPGDHPILSSASLEMRTTKRSAARIGYSPADTIRTGGRLPPRRNSARSMKPAKLSCGRKMPVCLAGFHHRPGQCFRLRMPPEGR